MAAAEASTKAALRGWCRDAEVKWRISDGTSVKEGDVVADLIALDKSKSTPVWSPEFGVVHIHATPTNEASDGSQEIGWVDICQHDVLTANRSMCQICLRRFEDGSANQTVKVIMNDGMAMQVSHSQAKKLDSDNITRMLKSAKLTLVLDLDHTLLHAVRLEDVVDSIDSYDDVLHFEIPGIPTPHVLKLRPGLATFLANLSAMYELCIYTHGTRKYAEKIADIIDPTRKLFNGRIISRSDTPDIGHKDLKFLFPSCDDSMIIILDDRVDVWRKNYENVFIIEAFHFFNTRAELNNASGGKDSAGGIRILPKGDTHLEKTFRVLQAAHARFYQAGADEEAQLRNQGRSVKRILYELRHEVLRGVNIVFSGVIRLDKPPEVDYLWKLALSFGAKPSMTMDNFPITHLIIDPRRLGSKKHVEAVEMKNVVVVNPQWLVDSASEWSKQDEAKYAVKFILTSAQQDREAAEGASKAGDDGVGNEEAGQDAEATTSSRKGGEVVVPSSSDRPEGTEDPAATQESDKGGASSEIATFYDEIDHNIEDAEALKSQNTEATIPSPEDVSPQPQSVVKGILSAPETIGQKPKKSVRFTPDVKEPTVQFQNLPMRHRVMHRKGPLPARVTPAGVVESGGSFEFVQRIAKLKAKASPAAALPKFNRVAIPAQVPIAARTKKEESVDDIMDKWANMEDEEEVQQPKRKSALFQEKHAEAAKRAKRQLKEEAAPPPAADDADDDEGVDDLDDELFNDDTK
ncbi:hypothetical protein, variant 1 [Aphanomyces invadans]|uniref:RNA polymerase II subunit A C-terminal domain phosphatase n=2 Tax=Aphanomyces invadans TaxID=157072 RepID=A0A024UK86_9STRA|nr:hypothetical protein, variant 1 [Aphanomyces invadans]ETW06719.1 hypothetical protein, variant 1 [Aphanomyces invadans]|eukprot:XP_008864794.1 hypothetical protein, variant 1 [Aphanomyces invadans]